MIGTSLRGAISVRQPASSRRNRADWIAVGLLVAVPLVVFTVAAALGATVMPGDDSDQNYPMRVLAGRQIAAGHLPLLNPYIWSGAPNLGGWNAGAAYPFTALFAIMPAHAAWVGNEILTYITAGLGLYAFLRSRQIRPLGAWLGATTFTCAGTFAIQVEHFGLVAGVSWVPFAMLALARLTEPGRDRIAWSALLGISGAMCVLAGEPRAIDDAAIILGAYGIWLFARSGRLRWRYLLGVAGGTMLAICLSSMQWLPGLHAVGNSQRSDASFRLFSSGSIHIPWLALITQPVLIGGSGSFRFPGFLSGYNLPEIAFYVGLLPLVAFIMLLTTIRRPIPEWLIWHVLVLVGLVLALGGHTPLAHILYHVPFFGSQRLQSRNVMMVDLALAVLLGYWVEQLFSYEKRRRIQYLAGFPAVFGGALSIVGLVAPHRLADFMGVPRATAQIRQLQTLYWAYLAIAVLVLAFLVIGPRLNRRVMAFSLVGVLLADLLLAGLTVTGRLHPRPAGPHDLILNAADGDAHEAPLLVPKDRIGRDGRFLVYGPDGIDSYDLGGIGATDLNVIQRTYSMQGYSAIVEGRYADATGTHAEQGQGHNTVALRAVGDGTLDQLTARYLVTLPRYLLSNPDVDKSNPVTRGVRAGQRTQWFFGQSFDLRSVDVPVPAGRARIGLLLPGGGIRWLTNTSDFGRIAAVGVVAQAMGGPARVTTPTATTSGGHRLYADGALQSALSEHHWHFVGNLVDYAVFVNPTATAPLTVQPLPGKSLGAASVRRIDGDPLLPMSARVSSPNGALVVRSVADIPGWSATWAPAGSKRTQTLPVVRHGLVQAVAVPSGTGTLRWRYHPPGVTVGLVLTAVGLFVLVGAAGYLVVRRRRRVTDRGSA